MAKYKVKPETYGICSEPCDPKKPEKHYPTVYFPVSKEMLKDIEVGEEITIVLKGKVKSTELRESADKKSTYDNKCEVRMEIYEVSAEGGKNDIEKLDDEDDE